MKRPELASFLTASTRLQYESQYWTGYDPRLIEQVGNEAKRIEEVINALCDENNALKTKKRQAFSRFAIVTVCLTLFIGFCVFAGTYWSNAYKAAVKEVRVEFENEGPEKLGYQKFVIGEDGYTTYTIFVKRNER